MAQRERPQEEADPDGDRQIVNVDADQLHSLIDPAQRSSLAATINDGTFRLLRDGQWRDRQQHGRLMYDQMMRHGGVSSPFGFIQAFLQGVDVRFTAPQSDPTDQQQEMADFLNAQLKRLDWTKFIEGFIGQGLHFGFSLAEMTTTVEPWKGRPFVQVDEVGSLPQASLDNLPTVDEEMGTLVTGQDVRYTCFEFDDKGNITAYKQFDAERFGSSKPTIEWSSEREMNRILHFKHHGGDGNPYGQSLLWTAFYHWSDLYMLERLEQVFLENAHPWLIISYDSEEPDPEVHKRIQVLIDQSDLSKRAIIGNRIEAAKVTATDPDYADHMEAKKEELRRYITQSMLLPQTLYQPTGLDDLDSRNLLQVFFRFTFPALMKEIGELMEEQFGKRLIDSNWTHVEERDYPNFEFRIHMTNELRASMSLIMKSIPYLDSDRLGEALEAMIPGFLSEWVAPDHAESVARNRPLVSEEAQGLPDAVQDDDPPPKEPGETREDDSNPDGNIGQTEGTST